MATRRWLGLLSAALGATGLIGAYRVESQGGDTGVVAALSLIVLAGGALLLAADGGPVTLRVTGGLLFLGGIAVIVTHHQLWYWLPGSWEGPVSLAALIITVGGLSVLLFGYGFSLAGLSGALGLLALACLMLTVLPLPDVGSWESDVLRVIATALGGTALTAGLIATAATQRRPNKWRAPIVTVAIAGAVATLFAAFDSYDIYAPGGYKAVVIAAAILGVCTPLAFGLIFAVRAPTHGGQAAGGKPVPDPTTKHPQAPPAVPTAQPPPPAAAAAPPAVPSASTVPAAEGTATSPAAMGFAAAGRGGFLQTAAIIVGLITGIITIAKELISAARALLQ